jgi:NAD(P)-dependent dehydrogenase (short-subunit alcohol dehydrogenase family)
MTDYPMSLFDVSGQVTVITGASGALGRVVAVALGARGAKLVRASGSVDGLEEVAEQARAAGGTVATVVRRPDSLQDAQAIVDTGISQFGVVDSVFVASGYNKPAPIVDMAYADWQAVMDANVRGPWFLAKAFGTHAIGRARAEPGSGAAEHAAASQRRGGRGRMVLVSSVRGRHGSPSGYTAYCTSKGAVDALTKTLATEWGPHGINVNAIAPTVFRSTLTEWIYADTEAGRVTRERNLERIAMKRLGEPEDFVGISLYLLSAASDFVTGQIIYVDGGYTAG